MLRAVLVTPVGCIGGDMRMKTLYQATKDRCRELTQSLKPKFGVDSGLVATVLTMNLRARFGNPDALPKGKRREYLTALQRLPKGGKAPMALVSSYGGDSDPALQGSFDRRWRYEEYKQEALP